MAALQPPAYMDMHMHMHMWLVREELSENVHISFKKMKRRRALKKTA